MTQPSRQGRHRPGAAERAVVDVPAGRPPSAEGLALPLAQVAVQYIADLRTRARPGRIKESEALLLRVIAELEAVTVGDLNRVRVQAWRQQRVAAGSANKTVNNALAVLLAALALCVSLGQLEAPPIHGLHSLPTGPRHQRRRPRALSEWEIARLLAAADELDRVGAERQTARATIAHGTKGAAYETCARAERIPQAILVRALIETGARWGELTQATWADLDEPGAYLTLRAEHTKTDTERSVPLRRDLLEELGRYRLGCARSQGSMPSQAAPIFLSPQGRPMTTGTANFRRFLGAAYERAGLLVRDEHACLRSLDGHALNVHTLRHTCCTRLALAGTPIAVVQAILGHSSPAMTLRVYSHVRAEAGRSAIEGLTPLCSRGSLAPAVSGVSPKAPDVGPGRSLQDKHETASEAGQSTRLSGS